MRAFLALLFAVVVSAQGQMTIDFHQPWLERVGDPFPITVLVQSSQEIKSVVAEVQGRQVELQYAGQGPGPAPLFSGVLALEGLVRGRYDLKVTATDVFNSSKTATKSIFLDRAPIMKINALPEGEVVRTLLLPADISCEDDAGCELKVFGPWDTPVTYTNGVLNLTPYDHSTITLRFFAIEGPPYYAQVEQQRTIHVETSPRLTSVERVPGPILDFDAGRVLFQGTNGLAIFNRTNQSVTLVSSNNSAPAFLTPVGAVYVHESSPNIGDVVEFPGASLGPINSPASLIVSGPYFIWNDGFVLRRRNVLTAQTTLISDESGNWQNDLTAAGDVAYWHSGGTNVFLNGRPMAEGEISWNVYPRTDGTNVVWRRQVPVGTGRLNYWVMLNDGSGATNLSKALSFEPTYLVANGWVAYTDVGNSGAVQIWRRSPSGEKTQLSFFGSGSRLEALAPNGEVLWSHNGVRYLNTRTLGNFLGTPAFKDGQWHMVIGRELFALNTDIGLSIRKLGEVVIIEGLGTLERSSNLRDWIQVGPIDGTYPIPQPAASEGPQFFRVVRE